MLRSGEGSVPPVREHRDTGPEEAGPATYDADLSQEGLQYGVDNYHDTRCLIAPISYFPIIFVIEHVSDVWRLIYKWYPEQALNG